MLSGLLLDCYYTHILICVFICINIIFSVHIILLVCIWFLSISLCQVVLYSLRRKGMNISWRNASLMQMESQQIITKRLGSEARWGKWGAVSGLQPRRQLIVLCRNSTMKAYIQTGMEYQCSFKCGWVDSSSSKVISSSLRIWVWSPELLFKKSGAMVCSCTLSSTGGRGFSIILVKLLGSRIIQNPF